MPAIKIPPEYENVCLDALLSAWEHVSTDLREQFGISLPLSPGELRNTPLAENLAFIARAASGQEQEDVGELREAIQDVLELFFAPHFFYSYSIPGVFWDSALGQMILRAWVAGAQSPTPRLIVE